MLKKNQNQLASDTKKRDLFFSIAFDIIGMLSFSVPLIGEFSDVIWAPISSLLMMRMYKGRVGRYAGMFSFLEEILPLTDFIPSFTLMWVYTYVFVKKQ